MFWILFAFLAEPEVVFPTKQYSIALEMIEARHLIIDTEDVYKKYSMTSKEINDKNELVERKLEFTKLPPLEKAIFYLSQCEEHSNEMHYIEDRWRGILAKNKKMDDAARKALTELFSKSEPADKPPTDQELEVFITKLHSLRMSFAIKYEELIDQTFKKYTKEIPVADRNAYTQKVKKWHDSQSLIPRKKS